jgi:hypothetical protein
MTGSQIPADIMKQPTGDQQPSNKEDQPLADFF